MQSNNVPVVFVSYKDDVPAHGYWDMSMLDDLLMGELWQPAHGYTFTRYIKQTLVEWPTDTYQGGQIVVIPGRAQADMIEQLNRDIAKLAWVIVMVTGDEEGLFPYEDIKVSHPHLRVYVMSPRPGRPGCRHLGTGYSKGFRAAMATDQSAALARQKDLDWFFAGQITHDRRREMADQLHNMLEDDKSKGELVETEGFTQGLPPKAYAAGLAAAKVAPAPSGPETPDTFRLFEALEAGCVPIADTRVSKGGFPDDYWTWFFGEEPPFPVLTDYEQLPGYTGDVLHVFEHKANTVSAWWMKMKRKMAYQLRNDIFELTATGRFYNSPAPDDNITVIIPTSPIHSHPSTAIIEETIATVRHHLPTAEIIIAFDGVRPEQEDRREAYEHYTRMVIWKCHHEWKNVLPVVYVEHQHQARMTADVLKHYVKTPTILFVEHDTPLTPDVEIPFKDMVHNIIIGNSNVIRLHHEALVLPEHAHMMVGEPFDHTPDMRLWATAQWSQRPHLASAAYYKHILSTYFHPESRTMIEDVMHGVLHEAYQNEGSMGWNMHRVWLYAPLGGNMKRSYHLDGRGDDPKYDMDIREVEHGNA